MDEPTTTENYDQKSELDAVRSELKELNAEFKLVRGFQDSIIRTSQWALTTVFALGALLVGFHWYTNNDAIERQRALIAEEVTSDLKKGLIADFQSLESQSKADLARFEDKTKANIEGDIVDLKLKLLRASALTDLACSPKVDPGAMRVWRRESAAELSP